MATFVAGIPAEPPYPLDEVDFLFVHFTLNGFFPEYAYTAARYDDVATHERLFALALERLRAVLDVALRWNREHGVLTFVSNFVTPQQNAMGRLFPRYDLRNPVFFVEELNRALSGDVSAASNAYVIDIDQMAASLGKRYIVDDVIWPLSNGSVFTDADFAQDQSRIEPPQPLSEYYPSHGAEFETTILTEVLAAYRTIRQVDAVKLVVIDLDDTLWRGVAAEIDVESPALIGGWPLGFIEALRFLKKRGILLAIVSKNDESRIEQLWDLILDGLLSLDDFAVRKINWNPKADNLALILEQVKVLPKNVVFVDDNPTERALLKAAFPDLRVLGSEPYLLRRILLWAPETQVAGMTDESVRRTEMMQAQVEREALRAMLPREELLKTLGIKIEIFSIDGMQSDRLPRVIELLNRTNQFNTTGKRWSREACGRAFESGTKFYAFESQDRLTRSGLVGVVIVRDSTIEQFVMSCRVMGLEIELSVLAGIQERMRITGHTQMTAMVAETEANGPCRDVFSRAGFTNENGLWKKPIDHLANAPAFIEFSWRE